MVRMLGTVQRMGPVYRGSQEDGMPVDGNVPITLHLSINILRGSGG